MVSTSTLRLEDEIAAARVAGRRMLELSKQMTDPMDGIRALSLFSNHLARIASLMRAQAILTGGGSETSEAISVAILAVAKEFNIPMSFFQSPQSLDSHLSDFLLQHLQLLEIRFTLQQPQTLELSRCLQQTYDNPTLPNLLDCIDLIRAYRRSLLN